MLSPSSPKLLWIACIVIAIAAAYLLVGHYFPYLGISVTLISFCLVGFFTRPQLSAYSKIFGSLSFFFALMLVIRSNPQIILLDIVASIFFGSLMLLTSSTINTPFEAILAPITTISELFQAKASHFSQDLKRAISLSGNTQLGPTLISLVVTVLLLLIIVPVLAAANPIFNSFVSSIINVQQLFADENLIRIILRLIVFSFVLWFIIKIASYRPKANSTGTYIFLNNIPLLIPQLAVFIVLTIFIATQLNLYMLTTDQLAQYDLTHSQRTREVFAHLSIVSLILLGLHYYSLKQQGKYAKTLYFGLLIQGLILNFFALTSDIAYINSWGFTYKRLWGLLIVTFIFSSFTMASLAWLKTWSQQKFLHLSLIAVGVVLVVANLLHFDYLIYHFRPAALPNGVDYGYLARLSPDSYSLVKQINLDLPLCLKVCQRTQLLSFGSLLYTTEKIVEKYSDPDIGGFNLAEFITSRQLSRSNINIEKIQSLRQQINQVYSVNP